MSAPTKTTATQPTFMIQGREVRLPVEVRDATAAVAYYLVSASAAQRLIAPTGLSVAQVLPGRTFCTIGTMVYRDGDLGPYRELAVTFFVREPGNRALPLFGTTIGLVRGSLGAYIHQLPVDAEFSRDAGCTIWGFPKFLADIAVSTQDDVQTSVLSIDGRTVLTHEVRTGGSRAFRNRSQPSYAYREGRLYRTPSLMSGSGVGARLGGATIEFGSHPLADELRTLGFPKRALFSTFVAKMSGSFQAADIVASPAGSSSA